MAHLVQCFSLLLNDKAALLPFALKKKVVVVRPVILKFRLLLASSDLKPGTIPSQHWLQTPAGSMQSSVSFDLYLHEL
jgi:hypothetical protein